MRTALVLFGSALVARLVLIALFPDPAYVDSFYYVNVAHALHAGQGFNIDFIWTFVDLGGALPANPHLPIPSNAHWMPLASVVQLPFIAALGTTPPAAALPFALIGALAAPLTWGFAREAGARRDVALGAAVLVVVPVASFVFMGQPDNFSLYQPIVLAALWLGARGLKGDGRAFAASGFLVGLAMLARNDGVLVGAALGLVFVANRLRAWRSGTAPQPDAVAADPAPRPPTIPWWSAVACLGLFVVTMAPWWVRQLDVFGSISPSSASGRILWIRSLAEMNSIEGHPTIAYFFGQGIGSLVVSRLGGLAAALEIYAILIGGVVLVPFMVIGGWLRRRAADYLPFFLYAFVLFGFSGLVSAVHVPNGTFIHSAVALAPQSYILALEGVVAATAWAARRRRAWDVGHASRTFVIGAVAIGVALGIYYSFPTRAAWTAERQIKQGAGAALDAAGAARSDVVMSLDTGGVLYWTGHPGVVAPADSLATIETVARAYGVRWLLVEERDLVPALAPILAGTARPAWVGPATWQHADPSASGAAAATSAAESASSTAGTRPAGTSPDGGAVAGARPTSDAALFPVCFGADLRCGPPQADIGASP